VLNSIYQSLNPIAFSIGPLVVRWYGLAYLAAFVCAYLLIVRIARYWELDITSDDALTIVLSAAFGVLIGARLGYCLFYGDGYYLSHPLEVLMLSEGGMSFHGGLVGCLIGGLAASHILKVPFLTLADFGAIVAPVGLFFGRIANFINGELWGKVTSMPWGVVFPTGGSLPRHPSQLYEAALEGIVLFVILFVLARRKPARPRGTFLGIFMLFYGIFRFLIEFVRVPDAQLGYIFGGVVTMGQILSIPVSIAGVIILLWVHRHPRPQQGRIPSDDVDVPDDSPSTLR
jgi:phosphatidylglycerol:prolipoprotein diacylglycerol transferase